MVMLHLPVKPNGRNPEFVFKMLLDRAREIERVNNLTCRSMGHADLGLDPNKSHDWKFLERLGVSRIEFELAAHSLQKAGYYANEILEKSMEHPQPYVTPQTKKDLLEYLVITAN